MRILRKKRKRQAAELARLFVALDSAAGARSERLVAQSHKRAGPATARVGFRSAA